MNIKEDFYFGSGKHHCDLSAMSTAELSDWNYSLCGVCVSSGYVQGRRIPVLSVFLNLIQQANAHLQ